MVKWSEVGQWSIVAGGIATIAGLGYWINQGDKQWEEQTAYLKGDVTCSPKEGYRGPIFVHERRNKWNIIDMNVDSDGKLEAKLLGAKILDKLSGSWINFSLDDNNKYVFKGAKYECPDKEMNPVFKQV